MADLCITKKITKAKCSEPKWLCARKSKVNSTGKKQETYRVIKNAENYLLDTNRRKSQEISVKMQPEGELKSVYITH